MPDSSGAGLARAVARRHEEITERLTRSDGTVLEGNSRLPGWDRLTIVCHLRYGAIASRRMTAETLAGRSASYYPHGRERQRAATLIARDGESGTDVVNSFDRESRRLDESWQLLGDQHWQATIREPAGNPDLGPIDLWTLALLRLTEVEVHGHDLDLGLSSWSETFVETALPTRLRWLPTRRSNHRRVDRSINGRWAIAVTDGPTFLVQARGTDVEVTDAETEADADAAIAGTAHQLLAFLLGRETLANLEVHGDSGLAHAFLDAFPAP